jgi:thymidylate kinase
MYEEERVERMGGHYVRLLESIVERAGERISRLQMLTHEELLQQQRQEQESVESAYRKFVHVKPKAVSLSPPAETLEESAR